MGSWGANVVQIFTPGYEDCRMRPRSRLKKMGCVDFSTKVWLENNPKKFTNTKTRLLTFSGLMMSFLFVAYL